MTTLYEDVVPFRFFIDGGGVAITTGIKGTRRLPPWATGVELVSASLYVDQTGSITIDIWSDTHANYPPTNADTITGGNEPAISSGTSYEDLVLSGWTRNLKPSALIHYNVDSVATVTWCSVELMIRPVILGARR